MQSVEHLREIIAEQQLRIASLERRLAHKLLLLEGLSRLASADPTADPYPDVFRSLHEVFRFDRASAFVTEGDGMRCIAAESGDLAGLCLPAEGALRLTRRGRVVAYDLDGDEPLSALGGRHLMVLPTMLDDRRGALILARGDAGFDQTDLHLGERFSILAQQALAVKRYAMRESENRRLRELNEREAEARRGAEEASRAKTRFLANMSHEIRTPMNGIISMAEMLEESRLDDEQWLLARTISASSQALLRVINDILDFSRIEADRIDMRADRFDFAGLVYEVARLLVPRAAEKILELCVDVPADLPQAFVGDSARLRQVLLNLLGNAIKFTEAGHVRMTIRYRAAEGLVTVAVDDSGIGIAPDKLDVIFTAFERADEVEKGHVEGTGLGLAISERLVRLMGGSIGVESAPGAGTTFTLDLPFPVAEPVVPDTPDPLLAGRRVALLEPHPIQRAIVRRQLEALGAEVDSAGSPDDLLARMRDRGGADDILLVGTMRPDKGHLELVRAVRALGGAGRPRCVLMGAGMSQSEALRQLGFSGMLMKPARTGTMGRVLAGLPGATVARGHAGPDDRAAGRPPRPAPRVLVAEDNRTNQLVMRKLLGALGIEPDFAVNGVETVSAATGTTYDLVFMDISMPVMGGLEATRLIREMERRAGRRQARILALTAHALEEHQNECFAAGMNGFLTKPVSRADIARVIADLAPVQMAE
jgi:signal transduction histidine kinase/DNA-binding response OmpR family regulator